MITIPEIFPQEDSESNREATQYINTVLCGIIRCILDIIRDSEDAFPGQIPYILTDICPGPLIREDPQKCKSRVYELYDLLQSSTIRKRIRPIYEYILFHSIDWYLEVSEITDTQENWPLSIAFRERIVENYGEDEISSLTDLSLYQESCFRDWDFLPEFVNEVVQLSLENPFVFSFVLTYEELDDYVELMDTDLRDEYLSFRKKQSASIYHEDELLQNVLKATRSVQKKPQLFDFSENELNDEIRDALAMVYEVKDQTRHGESESGKGAGELDFLIVKEGNPVAIAEALKMKSLEKDKLKRHLDKVIYTYDPIGYPYVFLIIYSTASNLNEFWKKCFNYLSAEYQFRFPLYQKLYREQSSFAETKIARTIINRNEMPVFVNIIVAHLRQKTGEEQ